MPLALRLCRAHLGTRPRGTFARGATLALLFLLVAAGGCRRDGPTGVRQMADGRLVPNWWGRHAEPLVQDRATRRLHYDSLYVTGPTKLNVVPRPRGWDAVWETRWYRFWDGGQVLEKTRSSSEPDYAPPTAADGDDFRGAGTGVGRYSVVGDRISMRFLGFNESGWRWVRDAGHVNEDGSFTIVPRRPVGFGGPPEPPVTYRRHVVGEMKRFPDW